MLISSTPTLAAASAASGEEKLGREGLGACGLSLQHVVAGGHRSDSQLGLSSLRREEEQPVFEQAQHGCV
jgi:hypothetical protein